MPTVRAAAPQTEAQRVLLQAAIDDRDRRFSEAKTSDDLAGERMIAPMGLVSGTATNKGASNPPGPGMENAGAAGGANSAKMEE